MKMAITPENVSIEEIEKICGREIDALQLRRKTLAGKEYHEFAKEVRAVTKKRAILFIVNDRLDIALSVGADGVHLPQSGLPATVVRKYYPLVGVSTHSLKEAIRAEKEGATYVTLSSPTKGAELEIELLKSVVQALSIPVLPLGCVNESNIEKYQQAGAQGYAAIRFYLPNHRVA